MPEMSFLRSSKRTDCMYRTDCGQIFTNLYITLNVNDFSQLLTSNPLEDFQNIVDNFN